MARFDISLPVKKHSIAASFRQELPEPYSHGWSETIYIPVFWIPAIPASMTLWLGEIDTVLDELNGALVA